MNRKTIAIIYILGAVMMGNLFAQEVKLPAPDRTGGMPLMQALNERRSTRAFKPEALSLQHLGDLLWAAWGYNREDKRTAPTAINAQEIDLYVVKADGVWRYDARQHALIQQDDQDRRAATGTQPYVASAPVNLVFVADSTRVNRAGYVEKWSAVNAAMMAQNAYLYCASAGLGGVVRGAFDGKVVAEALKLPAGHSAVLCFSAGWPQEQPTP
ncbi:MAG: SagB/ThcOx family dehydrogenase [Lentisphaerae bacterium]|nr:SagB/ThcOx family dehydrogenase [Lentisphaerota bacterium]